MDVVGHFILLTCFRLRLFVRILRNKTTQLTLDVNAYGSISVCVFVSASLRNLSIKTYYLPSGKVFLSERSLIARTIPVPIPHPKRNFPSEITQFLKFIPITNPQEKYFKKTYTMPLKWLVIVPMTLAIFRTSLTPLILYVSYLQGVCIQWKTISKLLIKLNTIQNHLERNGLQYWTQWTIFLQAGQNALQNVSVDIQKAIICYSNCHSVYTNFTQSKMLLSKNPGWNCP